MRCVEEINYFFTQTRPQSHDAAQSVTSSALIFLQLQVLYCFTTLKHSLSLKGGPSFSSEFLARSPDYRNTYIASRTVALWTRLATVELG
jgi:hypothetical protein